MSRIAAGLLVGLSSLILLTPCREVGAAPLPSAAELADRLRARFERMQDYQCVMRSETRAAKKVEAATLRIWYRRPGLLRLRVVQGRQRGSELVLGADGTLRGRRSGLLRAFSRRLDRSDKSLRSLRGQPVWEIDFGSFVRRMQQRIAQKDSASTVREAGGSMIAVEVQYDASSAGPQSTAPTTRLRDVWTVNSRDWLLISGDVYDGAERVDHFEFSDVQVDTGLKESWFRF